MPKCEITAAQLDALGELASLLDACEAAKQASGRYLTRDEFTAEHRFNAAARRIVPILQPLLVDLDA